MRSAIFCTETVVRGTRPCQTGISARVAHVGRGTRDTPLPNRNFRTCGACGPWCAGRAPARPEFPHAWRMWAVVRGTRPCQASTLYPLPSNLLCSAFLVRSQVG